MIEINPQFEAIFDAGNIDDECTRIAALMEPVGVLIKEAGNMNSLSGSVAKRAGCKEIG